MDLRVNVIVAHESSPYGKNRLFPRSAAAGQL